MPLHIGKLISKRIAELGMRKAEFARRIHKSRQNVNDILKRRSVDTELLHSISKALGMDFFSAFNVVEDEKSAPGYGKIPARYKGWTNRDLIAEMEEMRKTLEAVQKEVAYLKKINALLEKRRG